MNERFFIVGGAGFIGGHFVDSLLADSSTGGVTVFDNFSSGRRWHLEGHKKDARLTVIEGDVKDQDTLAGAMAGHTTVIHLASNPDIAKAMTDPDIDFREGTALTRNVVEAMRMSGASRILYASGSGVYGELGEVEPHEDWGPMIPVSTYGASKLAGETLISSYAYMFDMSGCAFRFGNVVGARQTHGVGFDFLRKLRTDPARLSILGDGSQSKSYIGVSDVVEAVLLAHRKSIRRFDTFNVATGDYITVKEIAGLAIEVLGLDASCVTLEFSGGDRGWKGDVPIVRLNTGKIQQLGWKRRENTRDALRSAMTAMLADAHRLWN